MGLARRSENLAASGLTAAVIATIQGARAQSTRSLYDFKWNVFHSWCLARSPDMDPFLAPIGEVLNFLQSKVDEGLTYSTIKVWLASVSACHVGYDGKAVSRHLLMISFMKGVKRAKTISRPLFPAWDLAVVLGALCTPPFEPLESVDLRILSLKTVLLVALTTAKRVMRSRWHRSA